MSESSGAKPWMAFALYLPLIAAVAWESAEAMLILVRGARAGAFGFFYLAVLAVLVWRARSVWQSRTAGWAEIVLIGVADVLLAVIALG